jgi:hypothetical protein
VSKIKISILGLFSIEHEEKDDEIDIERKLQIDLAKLQADIQLWGTFLFGSLAFFAALFTVNYEEYFSTDNLALKAIFLYATTLIGVFAIISLLLCTVMLLRARAKLHKLE